jgi:hypothetical protein
MREERSDLTLLRPVKLWFQISKPEAYLHRPLDGENELQLSELMHLICVKH